MRNTRSMGLECLALFLLIIIPFECSRYRSEISGKREKKIMLLLLFMLSLAGQISFMGGCSEAGRKKQVLVFSSPVSSLGTWYCCRSLVTNTKVTMALPSCPHTATPQHRVSAHALQQPRRHKTAPGWQSMAPVVPYEMLAWELPRRCSLQTSLNETDLIK